MSDATEIIQDVAEALQDVGLAVTLSHVTRGTGPDATGDSTATASTYGVLDGTKNLGFTFGQDLVQSGDLKLTIPGGGSFAPVPGDTATAAGSTWTIIAVRPQFYGAEVVTHELLVRR